MISQVFTYTFLKRSCSLFSYCISCADVGPNKSLSNVFWKVSNNGDSTTAQTNPFQYYPYCWKAASPFPPSYRNSSLQFKLVTASPTYKGHGIRISFMSCLKSTIFLPSFLALKQHHFLQSFLHKSAFKMYVWVCCCMQMWKESKGQQMVNGKKK